MSSKTIVLLWGWSNLSSGSSCGVSNDGPPSTEPLPTDTQPAIRVAPRQRRYLGEAPR